MHSKLLADMDFEGQHADEELHFYCYQHSIRLLWPLTKLVAWNVLIAGLGYLTFVPVPIEDPLTRRALLTLFTVFFLFAHIEFLARFYRYFLYVIVATDRKIHRIKKTLLLIDDHQSIDLSMLQDMMKSQHSIIQKLFGFGTITLEAQDSMMRLHFMPHIHETYEMLMHLREVARAKAANEKRGSGNIFLQKPLRLFDTKSSMRKSVQHAHPSR
ncbi:MAG TPA: hypothetical protein VJB82_03515 [Candidatus Peribacterales bacterium]|nr:hypothetical protein [Candidatus Peribacterales bacterium]